MEQEKQLKELVNVPPEELIWELVRIYGFPKSSITRARNSQLKKSEEQVIFKQKLFFERIEGASPVHRAAELNAWKETHRHKPRFIIVTDGKSLAAIDTKRDETLDTPLELLWQHADFFMPWTGREPYQIHHENPADVKAAEKMAKIYDEIVAVNPLLAQEDAHALNVFLTRLLFCYFAEDTGIFPDENLFTRTLADHSKPDGSDLKQWFETLFEVLDSRGNDAFPFHFQKFPYVNGHLFTEKKPVPLFSARCRSLILECGELDWKNINPDIFGSMFQAVASAEVRSGLGQHYTSVPNIMKVIEPLFLNELRAKFEEAKNSEKNLRALLDRIRQIRLFDPACGSGNFLIIAYKQLRFLEIDILERLAQLTGQLQMELTAIPLTNFYGIEIDDFACEIATLSLWLAEHQMNGKFRDRLGRSLPTLPLKPSGNIRCANALRANWEEVCPKNGIAYINQGGGIASPLELNSSQTNSDVSNEIYILGNPPFLGSTMQTKEQKEDLLHVFNGLKNIKNLDYVTCWFYLASQYIRGMKNCRAAFVATNSITQGEQVGYLWPHILKDGIEIDFAHQSFKWTNNAKHNAGVTCVVVGLRNESEKKKFLFRDGKASEAKNINAYLMDAPLVFVEKEREAISDFPPMTYGNKPTDGGHFILSQKEEKQILTQFPTAKKFTKKLVGSQEFLKGVVRFCLWISEEHLSEAMNIPPIAERIEKVRNFRLASPKVSTQIFSQIPYRFAEIRHQETSALLVPSVSSERREYIPMGYLGSDSIISNAAHAVYDAPMWLFGVLTSRMHMVWVRAVGGRLETRLRYSAELCFNTFPFPEIDEELRKRLESASRQVIAAREEFLGQTMAELYDPEKMPVLLREAHERLDAIVDRCFQKKPFRNDEERLALLFERYQEMAGKKSNGKKKN